MPQGTVQSSTKVYCLAKDQTSWVFPEIRGDRSMYLEAA